MKKTILTLLIALATLTFCNAQKIEIEKIFGGYKYTQNGVQMTLKEMAKAMESNPEAFGIIKKAQSDTILSSIIGSAGGFLIGWPLGTALGGEDPDWSLAGIGAGLVLIGIPISTSATKKTKQAVELYNSSLNSTSFNSFKPEFKVVADKNGIGISVNF